MSMPRAIEAIVGVSKHSLFDFMNVSVRGYSGSQKEKESMAATSPDAQKVQPSDELPVTPAYKNIVMQLN